MTLEKPKNQTGTATRDKAYLEVYRQTRDHNAAVRTYCQGNVWAEENARAVGNWRT